MIEEENEEEVQSPPDTDGAEEVAMISIPAQAGIESHCAENIEPGEPYFILKASDVTADNFVDQWCSLQEKEGQCRPEKINDARRIARAMREWPNRVYPS